MKIERIILHLGIGKKIIHESSSEKREIKLERKDDWEKVSEYLGYVERHINENGFQLIGMTVSSHNMCDSQSHYQIKL